jgi:FkbM family methyltransferase
MKIHEWILKNIPKNATIIEAGTCEGIDTLFFADNFSEGKIYGFEPIFDLFEKAKNRISNRKNVNIYNMALSDSNGKKTMNVSDRFDETWGSSSLLAPKDHLITNPEITFKKQTEVETIRLDDFVKNNKIDQIDLMWLDMQGYEPIVLKDSLNSLNITKYLYTEVSTLENYEGIILYPEFKIFLEESGFTVVYEELEWQDGGNVLFANLNT